MSRDERNIDSPDLTLAEESDGNQHPTGHSAKQQHRVARMQQEKDSKEAGRAGRNAPSNKLRL